MCKSETAVGSSGRCEFALVSGRYDNLLRGQNSRQKKVVSSYRGTKVMLSQCWTWSVRKYNALSDVRLRRNKKRQKTEKHKKQKFSGLTPLSEKME